MGARVRPRRPGKAARLQVFAATHACRSNTVYYQGKNSTPGYYCANSQAFNGRGTWCLRVGGVRVDRAVVETFLEAIAPAGLEAAIAAQSLGEAQDQNALKQFRLQVERARYEAERAERRFRNVEPENRLVARTLETEWENKLHDQRGAEAELARKEQEQRLQLTDLQQEQIRALGSDLKQVWDAPTTTDRDRKELLRSLLEEVKINVLADESKAHLVLRWKTSAVSELDVLWRSPRPAPIRTDEETIELMRRLAVHHTDAIIAGVLNRQGRKTARGESFTANRVASLRNHWKIPCYQAPAKPAEGEWLTVDAAAKQLGVAASTLLRWLNDGFIGGEQVTPGAPWRIQMTNELKKLIVPEVPAGYVAMPQAMRILGVSRQTIMERVKRGELPVVHVCRGKLKGLRIGLSDSQPQLFDQASGKLQRVGTAADPFGLADSAPMAAGQTYCGRANCSVCSVADMTMGQAPPAHLAMPQAIRTPGASRPANMHRVKHGGLTVARTSRAEQKALHINTLHQQSAASWPTFNSKRVV